jgi:hypothetical protein
MLGASSTRRVEASAIPHRRAVVNYGCPGFDERETAISSRRA